jgi:hypothetical protein
MNVRKVQVKLFAEEGKDKSLESFIPVFHRWIRNDAVGEMLMDVADYTHVPRGPGVLLVGHGSDYAVDQGEDRPGLLYSRKRDLPAGADLLKDGITRALKAAELLNSDPEVTGPKAFGTQEMLFTFPDRLHVKNDEAGLDLVKPHLEAALSELVPGKSFKFNREGDPRAPLTIRAKA